MKNEYVNKLEDECEELYRELEELKENVAYLNDYIKTLEHHTGLMHDEYVELTGKAFDYGVERSG